MYVPLIQNQAYDSKYDDVGKNELIYSYDFTGMDRWFYKNKTNKILSSIYKQPFINRCDVVHAHYLFSAGGVAYRLKVEKDIDYIVAVRNTDLNIFFKYGIHLRSYAMRILEAASKIVFISPTYKDAMLEKYVPEKLKKVFLNKSIIIPNGIDDYWHNNIFQREFDITHNLELLFVGELTANKNIPTIFKAVHLLRAKGMKVNLTLVGDGPNSTKINQLIQNDSEFIKRYKWTDSKDELRKHYRNADIFIMPSFNETFGLVYIEALSQGLPLIYTRNQGIDGYFTNGQVGYACDPTNPKEICSNIHKIIDNYVAISSRCSRAIGPFSWESIARQYESIYESIICK